MIISTWPTNGREFLRIHSIQTCSSARRNPMSQEGKSSIILMPVSSWIGDQGVRTRGPGGVGVKGYAQYWCRIQSKCTLQFLGVLLCEVWSVVHRQTRSI